MIPAGEAKYKSGINIPNKAVIKKTPVKIVNNTDSIIFKITLKGKQIYSNVFVGFITIFCVDAINSHIYFSF